MRNQSDAGRSKWRTMVVLFGLASAVVVATHGDAEACGGLFCNGPPPNPLTPLPVAQNGENVVFSFTPDPAGGAPTLQAHIQILYTGDAAKFSWVVPVDAPPTLSTGTDRLFTALAGVTTPRYQPNYQTDGTCLPNPGVGGAGGFGGSFTGTGGGGGSTGAGGSGAGGVTVVSQGAVGPFDTAVVKSDDPTALKTWLTSNEYVVTDAASALIDAYVRENKYFVALRLLNGVGVKSIQPIVLTFRGTEACVPLRLTAIAANPNMPVLVWVLSSQRVAPRGYYEIKIDEARIDWPNFGSNYGGPTGLVSKAADEAGGNAFVTEYAGPSSVAQRSVYVNGQINLTALAMAMTPPAYVQMLVSMGLANDSLMLPLLAKYIPMPDAVKAMGISDVSFYGNLNLYWQQYAFPPYDLAGLTQAISDSIVTPRINAQMMIDGHPYLTRLNTFISPEEMTKDPFFFETRDLSDILNVHTAIIRTMCGNMEYMSCNAPVRLELTDGRKAWLRAGSTATTCQAGTTSVAALSSLPATEVAWAREETGEGTRVLDNTAAIACALATHNAKFTTEQARFPIGTGTGGAPCAAGTGGRGGAGGGGGTGGAAGSSGGGVAGTSGGGGDAGTGQAGDAGQGSGGSGAAGTPGGAGGQPPPDPVGLSRRSGGCGCAAGGPDAGAGGVALALAGLLAASLRTRSRRRRR
ncbi:MAG TPA: DUF2330 domain-containing protein [Polyangia bacterium]